MLGLRVRKEIVVCREKPDLKGFKALLGYRELKETQEKEGRRVTRAQLGRRVNEAYKVFRVHKAIMAVRGFRGRRDRKGQRVTMD